MRRKLLIGGLVLVLLLAFVGGIEYAAKSAKGSGAKDVANTFVAGVLAGDTSETYKKLSVATRKSETPVSWSAKVQRVSTFFRGQKATFKSTTTGKSSVAVRYDIKGNDGSYVLALILVQENKSWSVQAFNSQLSQ